jgi:uncharacterized cupredoxin-like copper-binding protein
MDPMSKRRTLAAILALVLAVSACATAQSSAGPTAAAGGTSVQLTLQEWAVLPVPASAQAGPVTFQVTNSGPDDIHEFVVLKTDLDPGALPTDANGAVTEEATGMEVIDEIEDIPVGQSRELTVTLDPGKYVLLCNIYSEDENESHYQLGMRTAFDVTS